jgi:Predicted hydrolase (HD superfamily)
MIFKEVIMLTRDEAVLLLDEEKTDSGLMRHALASESVLKELALRLGQPGEVVDLWAMTGLLHDVDYPRTKDNPPCTGLPLRK